MKVLSNNKYQLRITGRTYQHLANKRTSRPENNRLKRRAGRIQRTIRPYPTTRINQPRMGGMGRTGNND